jgi:toxin ParE1/3/4
MAEFYLTNKAVEDLGEIWDYTVENWSENQAEIYYFLIVNSFQKLAKRPGQGKSYEGVESSVFGFRIGQHVVFYRLISVNEIEIVRILHGMMDLKNHL